mmetsp:Transcript_4249/g.6283  ORF Transcript_4249/g.6283 Transcript_4249/m.6283 type:complete len:398 (-) Transcript_4249:98-1291(-)
MLKNIYIVAAKRTPFGAFGGLLKDLSATELGVASTKAALSAGKIDPSLVDACYFGNVVQSNKDAAYLARHVALMSGMAVPTPALTINRLCGSGFETVILGSNAISLNQASIVVCGGTENMSNAPFSVDGNSVRWGVALGKGLNMQDMLWAGLTDSYAGTPMGITAENLATKYNITREDCDNFAIRSQTLWKKAKDAGHFDLEMAPIEVKGKKGPVLVDTDEHPRPETVLEKIGKLKPVFAKDGVVTAASSSGICDGAGTIILASEEAVKEHQLTPLARLVSFNVVGCEPSQMGIGPVPAIQNALKMAGLTLNDMDRIEVNEAFAAQFLACAKALNLDMSKTNINGGAISLGHPLGASGSRITAHLANEFLRSDSVKYSVGAACIGGGQGIAVVLQRV